MGTVPCENRVELDGPNQFCLRTRTFCLARRALSSAVSSEERSDDNPDAAGGRTWGRSPAKTASSLTAPISSAFVLEPSALLDGPLAQRLEQGTHNPLVAGSNPAGPTTCERWWAPGMRTWIRRSERKRAEMGPLKGEGAAPSEASQSCRAHSSPLPSHPRRGIVLTMKTLFQADRNRCVSLPPEKRFLINHEAQWEEMSQR